MRLPYIRDPPSSTSSSEDLAIISRVRARRSPHPLQALDLTLLHSPPVADGWNTFLGAIRTCTSLPADIREIAICRVAVLNHAEYEWMHHAPIAREAGVGDDGMQEIREMRSKVEQSDLGEEESGGKGEGKEGGLRKSQRAVMDYTDHMTLGVKVPNEVFEKLKNYFSEREIVEITATVAAYNCVSRFLVALDVGEMNQDKLVGSADISNDHEAQSK